MATPTREDTLLDAKFKIIEDSLKIAKDNFGYFDQKTVVNSHWRNIILQVDELEALVIKAYHQAHRLRSSVK